MWGITEQVLTRVALPPLILVIECFFKAMLRWPSCWIVCWQPYFVRNQVGIIF